MTPLAQEIEATRKELCFLLDSPAVLQTHLERYIRSLSWEGWHSEPYDYEGIEATARMVADIAQILAGKAAPSD